MNGAAQPHLNRYVICCSAANNKSYRPAERAGYTCIRFPKLNF